MTDAELVEAAIKVMNNAYAPYSNFQVGAAIIDEHGAMHIGVNVENAAYPQGSCAEANAIGAMIAGGGKHIQAIAIAGRGDELCTPCGGCRQRIAEFATETTRVLICDENSCRKIFSFDELLPHQFGADNL